MANIIGIDIGGTKIQGIVWNGKKAVEELTIVTPKNLFEFRRNLLKLTDFLSAGREIAGIGAGMAGLVHAKRGILRSSPNLRFVKKLDLAELLKESRIRKAVIDNDANCFTRAEKVLGRGKFLENFVALTLGTGVGGGVVIGRELYRGPNNLGAELGHMVMEGRFFEQRFQSLRDKGDAKAMAGLLGQAFASLANMLAPQAIILGGGVARDSSKLSLALVRREMKRFLLDRSNEPEIIVSKLKFAGAVGAALMVSK